MAPTNIGEIHYHQGKQNNWSKQIEFSAERNQFEKKIKSGNEMYGNCENSYRPVIIGFVQYQHSSVKLVLKKWIDTPR